MALTIDPTNPVWTLLNTFEAQSGKQGEIVACLRQFTEDHARFLPGFVGSAVHASRDGARVVNYVQWRSEADLRAMLQTDSAQHHLREVSALSRSVTPVFYEVAYASQRDA